MGAQERTVTGPRRVMGAQESDRLQDRTVTGAQESDRFEGFSCLSVSAGSTAVDLINLNETTGGKVMITELV